MLEHLKGQYTYKKHLSFKSNKLWGYSVVKYFFTGLEKKRKKKLEKQFQVSTPHTVN